jgi:hypothetical protein
MFTNNCIPVGILHDGTKIKSLTYEDENKRKQFQITMVLLWLEFIQMTESGHTIKVIKESEKSNDKISFLLQDINSSINCVPLQNMLFGEHVFTISFCIKP